MSYEFEGEREYETEPAPDLGPLKSSRRTTIVFSIVAALIGGSAAFVWHTYDGVIEALPTFKSGAAPSVVSVKAFEEYQRAVAGNLRSNSEMLQAQDVEIKRLSDQVLQLVVKMDLLESNTRDAQAAIPSSPKAAPKKSAAKPAPRISTGGAPLPPEQGRSDAPASTTPPR